MTAFDFGLLTNGQQLAFSASGGDTISFGTNQPNTVTFTASGANLVATVGNKSVTLLATTLGMLTNANVLFASTVTGRVDIGDNTTSDSLDLIGNTIDRSANDGNNLIYGLGGGDIISVGDGNNVIFDGIGPADSTDGSGTQSLGSGSNIVYSNAGDDTVNFAQGAISAGNTTSLFLGLGNDTVSGAAHAGDIIVTGGSGQDSITLTAQTGNATVFGGNGAADSTDGADTIAFGTGSGLVYGNAGNDTITLAASAANKAVTIFGGLGNDTLTSAAGNVASTAVVYGNGGADNLSLANHLGNTTIFGGDGVVDPTADNDTIVSGTGNTLIYGNGGNDNITVGSLATTKTATVFGGVGDDTLSVTGAADNTNIVTFTGGAGNDVLSFNATGGETVIFADFASGDTTSSTLSGGSASTLVVAGLGSNVTIFNDKDADGVRDANEETFLYTNYTGNFNATNFALSGGSVLLTNVGGAAASLSVSTTATNDQLIAGSNGDTLQGGAVTGDNGVDRLVGGAGNDTFKFTGAATDLVSTDRVTGGAGSNTIQFTTVATVVDADFTLVTNVQTIKLDNVSGHSVTIGTAGNAEAAGITTVDASALTGANTSTIVAGSFDNALTFLGGNGVDTVTTGAGADSISGAGGADVIVAGAGIDTVNGGDNGDMITGGTGADLLTGGTGSDTFIFAGTDTSTTVASDSALAASLDRITDWSTTDDTLQFADQGTETFVAQATSQAIIDALNAGAGASGLIQAINALSTADGSTNAIGTAFQFGGNTYALVDNSAAATFVAGTDVLVRIDGLASLATGDFTYV